MYFRSIRHIKISITKGANPQGCFGTYNKVQFIMFIMILATVEKGVSFPLFVTNVHKNLEGINYKLALKKKSLHIAA